MREHSIFRSVFRSLVQRHWLARVSVFAALICATVASSDPALAHHAMEGGMPTTFAQGLLSGIAHPIIGPDHFAFIVAVGLLAATKKQGILILLAFMFTAMVGTGAHLMQWSLLGVKLFVPGSVLLFGILLALRNSPKTITIAALSALAGLFHGYAYGESIFGAEPTPFIAYLVGFTIIQLVVAGTAFCLGQHFFAQRIDSTLPRFRSAGLVISGIGVAFFLSQVVDILLPT